MKTIRDLAKVHTEMHDYYYKWRKTETPELEKNIDEVLKDLGYVLTEEDRQFIGDYNDIQGYLNCNIEQITHC